MDHGCPIHYSLLLLAVVPWAHLQTWHGNLSCDGAAGNSAPPHNLHCCLEGYLWLHFMSLPPTAEKDISTSIAAGIDPGIAATINMVPWEVWPGQAGREGRDRDQSRSWGTEGGVLPCCLLFFITVLLFLAVALTTSD